MSLFYYSDHYHVSFPPGHRFPIEKYGLLRKMIIKNGVLNDDQLIPASPATRELAMIAHDPQYVSDVFNLTLDSKKARRIGLPLQRDMVDRTLVSLDASFKAAKQALDAGISGALSSGTHHACYDHGEGFCFFNDFAVISKFYEEKKILIIDLDVHQGNGNGAILKNEENVSIIDIFCEDNYPYRKSLHGTSIGLDKNTCDDEYLSVLENVITRSDQNFDLILFQAGVDIYEEDRLGLLNISKEGIVERDSIVFDFAFKNSIPISFVIGGGYCNDINDTVECNFNTFAEAKRIFNF